jgi:hypothetical protein
MQPSKCCKKFVDNILRRELSRRLGKAVIVPLLKKADKRD